MELLSLQNYGRPTCNKPRASSHDASTVVDVVDKLDSRRVSLTTRSTCRGEIGFRIWDKNKGIHRIPLLLEIREFPYNTL